MALTSTLWECTMGRIYIDQLPRTKKFFAADKDGKSLGLGQMQQTDADMRIMFQQLWEADMISSILDKDDEYIKQALNDEPDFTDAEGNKWRFGVLEMRIKIQSQTEYSHGWKLYKKYDDIKKMAGDWNRLKFRLESEEIEIVEVLPPTESLPAMMLLDHSADSITSQWRKANAGLLEIVRFGAMLVENDMSLKRQTHKGCIQTGESIKGWLEQQCPEINYKTAMGYKIIAEQMRDKYKIPKKLPLTLALPQADGTISVYVPDSINIDEKKVEQYQREFYGMCEGKSMYQLTLDLGIREPKPRGGAKNMPKNFTEVQKLETQQDAAGEYWKGAVENMLFQVKSVKSHLLLSSAQLDQLLVQLRVVRDGLIEASGTEKKEK